jgi:hypothetical protein
MRSEDLTALSNYAATIPSRNRHPFSTSLRVIP